LQQVLFFAGVLIAESKSHAVSSTSNSNQGYVSRFIFCITWNINGRIIFTVLHSACSNTDSGLTWHKIHDCIQGINKLTSLRVGIGLSSSGGELALVVAKVGAEVGLRVPFYCQCCRYDYNYYLYLSIFYQIRLEIYREVC
jgi:monovalent cation:H+ antiporter-2, CPA2 family